MKDVMLDLETLGTRHSALILQIGACRFDRMTGEIGETFLRNVKAGDLHDKFTTDYETIQWWMGQSQDARLSLAADRTDPLKEALIDLASFLWGDDVLIWSHATFDMPILQNAFEVAGVRWPIPFRNARDLRTLVDLAKYTARLERGGTHHNALDDAKFQAAYASDAFRKLYGTA